MKVQQIIVVVLLISGAMNLMAQQSYTRSGMRVTQGPRRVYKGAIANKDINMMTPAEIARLKYSDLNENQKATLWYLAVRSGLGTQRKTAQQVFDRALPKPLNWQQVQNEYLQGTTLEALKAKYIPEAQDVAEQEITGVVYGPMTEDQAKKAEADRQAEIEKLYQKAEAEKEWFPEAVQGEDLQLVD